jgi:hypothetical protein
MKSHLFAGILLFVFCTSATPQDEVPFGVHFPDATIEDVMWLYKSLTGRDAIIASNVPKNVSFRAVFKSEQAAVDGIAAFLRRHYGIVLTNLEPEKAVSVTFNDRLKVTPAPPLKPLPPLERKEGERPRVRIVPRSQSQSEESK